MKWIYMAFRPDFLQAMAVCTFVFMIPLEHRSGWKRIMAAALAGSFLVGGALTMGYETVVEQQEMASGLVVSVLLEILFFSMPLVMAYMLLRCCTRLNRADALYGTACIYAVQHTDFCLSIIMVDNYNLPSLVSLVLKWFLLALVLLIAYPAFVRKLAFNGRYSVTFRKAVTVAVIMIVIGLVFNYPLRGIPGLRHSLAFTLCLSYDLFSCQFLLWLQVEQRKEIEIAASAAAERRLRVQMQEQYELSRKTIEIINRKCHDIKYQISALRMTEDNEYREKGLREIEKAVSIYDASVQTGNRVLDTVLTEKSLLCEQQQISWTCMADGALLDFITPVDLYTMFGNALDNAIESSSRMKEPAMRNVSVTVQKRFACVFIQIENYFDHKLSEKDGLYATTKPDEENHGFGLQSIKEITLRYGGSIEVSSADHIFTLSILIPLQT